MQIFFMYFESWQLHVFKGNWNTYEQFYALISLECFMRLVKL